MYHLIDFDFEKYCADCSAGIFWLLFKNTGEQNSNDGLVEIGTLSLITLRHAEERVSVRNWGHRDRNLARFHLLW